MQKSDRQLIENYLGGDEESLDFLIARYLNPIYNFAYRLSRDKHAAQDISQETFLKMWKHLKRFDPDGNFKAWLFKICHNTAMDYLRKKKPLAFSDFETPEDDNPFEENIRSDDPGPEMLAHLAENAEMIDKTLDKLTPSYKEIIMLHYANGLTLEEISNILKRPLNTIKSQHRRAIIALRNIIKASDI